MKAGAPAELLIVGAGLARTLACRSCGRTRMPVATLVRPDGYISWPPAEPQ